MDTQTALKKQNTVSKLTEIYLFVLLLGEPLVIWDGYFDVTEIKTAFFAVCTLVYLTARAVCALQFGRGEHAPETSDVFSLVLCAIALLASAGSGFFRLSLLGPAGRWQGAAMLWLYAGVFFALRDVPVRTGAVTVPLCAGLAVSAALACLDHLGFDPLGFGAALDEYSRGRYISTLGNINFAGAYLSLALPVCVHRLLLSERRPAALALGGVCAVGLWAVMAVRSECAILGLGAGLLLMPFVLGDRLEALRRWCLLWPAAALAAQLYRAAAVLCLAGFSSLTAALLRPTAAAAFALGGAGLYFLCRRAASAAHFRRHYLAAGVLLLAGAAAALILLNTRYAAVDLGGWEVWLRFTDEWGTDRLRIWKYCLSIYREFPLFDKLLGGGCGVLAQTDALRRIFPDAVLDAAHCEYLQILLNWGALGLLAYLGWLAAAMIRAGRSGRALPSALLAGLLAYAVQAAVNIAQAPGIVLFFPLLGALRTSEASGFRQNPALSQKIGRFVG
ncbi:MAG: O-antigen ligase family protein [Oscillospiraceae bacterium]|nr:O-antigen ligase family protein [Oscillospiraceae bacterium]